MLTLFLVGVASALLITTILIQEFNEGACGGSTIWISGLEFAFGLCYIVLGSYLQALLMMLPTLVILICKFIRRSGQREANGGREYVA